MLFIGLAVAACDKPRAMGDPTEILVAAPLAVWDALEEDLDRALVPRTFTVRDESVFDVAHTDPAEAGWGALRLLRQVLLIGAADYPAVAEAIDANAGMSPQAPGIFQVRNVWAQNQLVTILLLPPSGDPEGARALLPSLGEIFLSQFQDYAAARMFVTGPNEELLDSLQRNAGFGLTFPRVYRFGEPEPGVYLFRNDQPDPSSLIRNVTVDSRPRGEVALTADEAAAWRAALASRFTQPPQITDSVGEAHSIQAGGRPGIEVNGIWSNPPGQWPAAGPYFTRLIDCPDRTFVVDAWLYAPGVPKYEYMYQLSTILDSFQCGNGSV